MNLYLISQDENMGYDTYDSAVVAAPNEDIARNTNPAGGPLLNDETAHERSRWGWHYSSWCSDPSKVKVELIGTAAENIEQGVICASFNAG